MFVLIKWTAWSGDQRGFNRKWTEKKNFRVYWYCFVLFFCNSSIWSKIQFSLVQKYPRVVSKIAGKCDKAHWLLKRRCISWRTCQSVKSKFNVLSRNWCRNCEAIKKLITRLFAVTESTESSPTKVEENAAEVQSETGWFFFQMHWLNLLPSKRMIIYSNKLLYCRCVIGIELVLML